MKNEKASKDEILNLEKKLKELSEINSKYLKEKKNLEMTNEYLSGEIENKRHQIVKFMKNISEAHKPKSDQGINFVNKKANLFVLEEQITEIFNNIQKNCNAHLQEKFKNHIEYLYNMQKEMKVEYILIKKLDIKEEFLRSHKIVESNNPFENLKSLSKIGRLNYFNLKSCGPILMFRINLSSTFEEIRTKSCEIWNINSSTYSLYDDAFNNLEFCNDSKINDFFLSYQPRDSTLGQGQVVFYLIEKLKHQRELIDTQDKSIDSKSDITEDNSNKANIVGGNSLENCLDLIKGGQILKGIENYKVQKVDLSERFIEIAKMVDNNIFYICMTVLLIIMSIFSISSKKDVYNWSSANWRNKLSLSSFPPEKMVDMSDFLNYFIGFADINNTYNTMGFNSDLIYYGPITFRMFKTLKNNCIDNFAKNDVYKTFIDENKILCFYNDHIEGYYDTDGINNYKFSYPNETNITHTFHTPIGIMDGGGYIVSIKTDNKLDYEKKLAELKELAKIKDNKPNIPKSVQGIELVFCIYDSNLDVFIVNTLLAQNDINQNPQITVADSIPFITNVYETSKGSAVHNVDVLRLILIAILLTTIPIRIYQKYLNNESKGWFAFLNISVVVIFQLKNIMIICSFAFLLAAFKNFSGFYVDSVQYFNANYYVDLYDLALRQKSARSLDLLSFYLISLYSLKYLQFLESLQILFISFKKAAFEYFSLFVTIGIIFIGLSVLTNFVFGSYIYEYKSFVDSITMNIKIFIFIENTSVTAQFLEYYRVFSIIVLIIFIFLIRYFLLNLFYPIFIEYYRIEVDKFNLSKILNKNEASEEEMKFGEKLKIFICAWREDNRKKKAVGMIVESKNANQIAIV